ncbi:MAG TPA: hypothetical protein DDW68_06190, partial [Verrucomicrobiales bacterium]|nr:hypothetical protein [Verrucomicrobiales bacterium]
MFRLLIFLTLSFSQLSARTWTKGTTVNWVIKNPKAVAVFNQSTGEKIGDLSKGKLSKEVANFQLLNYALRDASGNDLETGSTKVEHYDYTPDSLPQEVPKGKVTQHSWNKSAIYPGTTRDYLVYVPAQYDASKPAALMVFQDGLRHAAPDGPLRATTVFDN